MSGQPSNHDDGIPTMGRATDRTANDDQPPPVAVPDAGDATRKGHGTMSHEERSTIPLPHEHVICEVRDLYYAIDLPAGGSPGRGDVNGWRPRAARFCRSLSQMKDTGGDGTAAERITASETSRKLELLEGVNCRVRAGDMVAVIGASGAGKSTFLDLLAGRKIDGEYAGQILQASGEASPGSSSRNEAGGRGRASVYVTQDDFHVAELTVRESLDFAVRLSMGVPGVTDRDRQVRVEELLNVLGLESCADVRVGNPLERGISGGQARRLSVGVGVSDLESVRLLLLDEPTTGLDSSSAMEVLNLARRLATRADRRAVVASVHQPSAEMFALFDKVLVLVGGHQAFFGPAAEASAVLSRPEMGIVSSPGQNPAEFILIAAKAAVASRLLSGDRPGGPRETSYREEGVSFYAARHGPRETSYREEGVSFYAARHSNGVGIDGEALLLESRTGREGNNVEQLMSIQAGTADQENFAWRGNKKAYAVGFCTQFLAVWRRGWMVELRRTEALWALVVKNTLVGILTAAVFWQEGSLSKDEPLVDPLLNDVTPAASNVMGLLYFATLYGLTGHLEAIPDMFEWKRHFERERAAGMYSTTVYWLVSSTVHMPVMFVGFVVYLNIGYWSLGLPAEVSKYLIFGWVILVTTLMGYSLAQTLSAATATPQAAFATWPLFLVTAANFTGFTVRLPAVRVWFRWLCEISFCRWPYELMVVNQFRGFKEGPQLLDLYFGENRQTSLGIAGITCLFYTAFLLLSLFFLQPRPSRLRVLDETPASSAARRDRLAESTPSAQGAVGGSGPLGGEEKDRREEILSQPNGGDRGGGGGGASRQGARMNARDADLIEVAPGEGEDGLLYYLEEGRKEARSAPTAGEATENDATLRAPLLGGMRRENMGGNRMGGVCEGSTVVFRDLHYFIHLRGGEVVGNKPASPAEEDHEGQAGGGELKREVHVLRGVTAVASPGQMVAILGPSGSGKTTLLDLLGGRKTPSVGRREGDIIVDGVLARGGGGASPGLAGNAYVMQDNVHHTALTVRQTLGFAAKLRMSRTATAWQREERVRSMVSMLGLGGVLDTKVGSESNRGISGGEAKRLSIAVEAMDLPGLLLLDEPTSGLDATTALEVVVAVRSLANLGRTVVASLHQPSAEMFELFDTCLLLTKGGHQAYFGETDRAMAYFSSIGLVPSPAATDINPADFLMSVASIGLPSPSAEAPGSGDGPLTLGAVIVPVPTSTSDDAGAARTPRGSEDSVALDLDVGYVGKSLGLEPSSESTTALPDEASPRVESAFKPEELQATFAESSVGERVRDEVDREVEKGRRREIGGVSQEPRWWSLQRSQRHQAGRSTFWLSAVLTHRELTATWQDRREILTAVGRHAFVGIFYGTLWWRLGAGKVYERVGVIFFSLVFVMLGNQQNIPRIFLDRLLFYREKGAGVYGAVEYWWSIGFAQVPLAVLNTSVYGILLYFLAGLHEDTWKPFAYFMLVIVLCNLISLAFCQMLAAATRTQDTAVSLFPIYLFFFIAFAGFIVRLPTLPGYLASWAPTVSFARWAMEGLVINEFKGNEEEVFPVPEGIPFTPEQIYGAFLEAYGFGKARDGGELLGSVVWILLGNLVLFRLLGLLCLKYATFERR